MKVFKVINEINDLQYAEMYDFILIEDSFNEAFLMDSILNKIDRDFMCAWISNASLLMEMIELNKFPMTKLILLDIRMPVIDGLECLALIKKNEHEYMQPVVMLSSSNHSSDIKQAYGFNCNGYIVKTNDLKSFREKLLTTLEFWIDVNTTR